MTRHKGTIKWFNEQKGFGFIVADDPSINNDKDVFLHITAVKASGLKTVAEGDKVTFGLEEKRGRVAACDIEASEAA